MRRVPFIRSLSVVALAFVATGAIAGAARGGDVTFAGKRINVIIGTEPGGGTDLSTRLVGRFLAKYLPGHPEMAYRNMPAGGGVQATNHFANEVARDGTAWMGGGNAYIVASTLRKEAVKYDPTKFNFLGGIARGGSVTMIAGSKLANLNDPLKPPVVIGTTQGADTWVDMLAWAAEYADWNMRFVVGYPGTGGLLIALKRGEIDAFGTSNMRMLKSLASDPAFTGLLQTGEMKDGKINSQIGFERVPTINALVGGKLSGVAAETFAYWIRSNQVDKWYALPPDTPANVKAAYTEAFRRMATDPEFDKQGTGLFGEGFFVQSADDITNIVAVTSYPSADKLDFIRRMKQKHKLPTEPLSDAELAALAKKLVKLDAVTATITAAEREGRVLRFKVGQETHKVDVSGSRTKVTIAGKTEKRSSIKAGMTCKLAYAGNGGEASEVACK